MNRRPRACPGRSAWRAGGQGLALLLVPGVAVQAQALQWQADALLSQSHWQEQAPQGSRLLEERGVLPGLRLQLGPAQAVQRWTVRLDTQTGSRDYNGQSSRGTPVQTDTRLKSVSLGLTLRQPLTPALALTADLSPSWLQRELHGVTGAAGYTEHWQWALAMVGLQWQAPFGGGQLSAQAEWGQPLLPRLRTQLPGLDPLTLRPRPGSAARLGLHGQWPERAGEELGLVWHAGLNLQTLGFRASPVVAGTLGGVLRAAVSQPATWTWDLQGQLGASWHWR